MSKKDDITTQHFENARDAYPDDDVLKTDRDRHEVADDEARNYVNPDLVISDDESKRMRRKIHRRVLPLMCLAYITQAMDKGTLGPASIDDVGAKNNDYALTSTLLWCGIIVGEPIANQLVRRFPLGKLLGSAMIVWSGLLMGLTFSLAIPPVFAIRFLLGFFESLFGPVLLSITVQWYLKDEQPFVSSIWQSMLGSSQAIMSLFGYAFYHLQNKKGGLHGWQWMTMTVSLFSFCSALVTFRFLPDSPARARWLSEEEKTRFIERVRSNNQGIKHKVFKKTQIWEAVSDPYTYLLFLLAFFNTLVVGGINTFNAILINQAFGFSVLDSQLLSIPLGFMVVITYMLNAYLVTKTKQTLLVMICTVVPNIVGTILLICIAPGSGTRGVLIFGFYLMQFFQSCNPSIFLMLSRNSAGQTKKSFTYATTYIAWAGEARWAKRYIPTLYIHLGLYGGFIITCLVTRILLVRRNKKKIAAQTGEDGTVVNVNARAFEDLTDIENPDFRYSI
uniref:Major facilitator superfamily (MFS) profile domain-containing protein n=1 Tax=Kwoniella bestiolae CBS 10118 TaxID=1296100 RepID=A0A1B9G9K6_9TREE|nr:hypothetical protein I302_02541 [Kwoniella bestiolae CBS 10118]OCF27696.1 hypothetical protein I302_02541 [Kwoniella bestiolae CBS 10118]